MQDEDLKKDFTKSVNDEDNKKKIIEALYDKISNLEFDVLKTDDHFYLEIYPFMEFDDTLVVRLSRGRTTSFELGMFKNGKQEKYLFGKYFVVLESVSKGEDYIDVGELLYYCEKKAKDFPVKKEPSTLNKEIDEGFKNPRVKSTDGNGRMTLGGETLEEDVAFNEWMHKRFK